MDRMRQTFRIYRNMPLDPRNLFPCIIALSLRCISVLDTLDVDDTETRRFAPSIVDTP